MPTKLEWQKTLRGADDLSDAEFRVLMIMSTYTDAQLGNARPGTSRLVADTCLTEKSLKKAVAALVTKGYLELVEQGGNQYGKGRANVYRLLPKSSTRGVADTPLKSPEGGYLKTAKGGTSSQGRGVADTPPSGLSSHQGPELIGECSVCSRPYAACRRADEGAGQWAHAFRPRGTRQAS